MHPPCATADDFDAEADGFEDLPVLGESRFDYQVRALRGEFTPEDVDAEADTERDGAGRILEAMAGFPAPYKFQVVGRSTGVWVQDERFVRDTVELVSEKVGVAINPLGDDVAVKMRGAKFISVNVNCTVESQAMIDDVLSALGEDERIVMKY